MNTLTMYQKTLRQMWWRVLALVAMIAGLGIVWSSPASAYTYNSYEIDDLSVTSSSSTAGATANVTMTFTMPAAMSTSGYFYVYSPYIYSYAGGTYNYDSVDMTNATITSSQLTKSYAYDTYAYFYPTANLTADQQITITLTGVTNPDSIEGEGTWSVYAYEWSSTSDYYNSMWGSASQVFGNVDLTVTMYRSNGTTPVSNVNVYLSYYNYNNWSDYEYHSGYTNTSGQVSFAGLTAGRAYSISFYYSGTATTDDPPASTTYTYPSTAAAAGAQTQSYNFVASNVTTHFQDKNGTAVNNAYWYFYKTDYSNYTTDYVWRYGYTDSNGLISGAADKSGNYTLYVANPTTWNYYSYDFTVSSSLTVSGLSDPIRIPSPEVSGTVKAGTSGASNVYMYIHNSNWSTYQYTYTDSSGNFEFALGKNCTCQIDVSSWGLPSGYFAPSPIDVTVTANTAGSALTINLDAATKTISGTITKAADTVARVTAGTPVTDATIYAYQSSGSYNYTYAYPDSSGNFTMAVRGGKWSIYIYQSSWPATWAYTGESMNADFADDSVAETAAFNIQVLPYNSHITGTVTYPNGTTVGANDVYMYAYGGENNNVYSYGYTNSSGAFDVNTTAGTFTIYIYFYGASGSNTYSAPSVDPVTVEAGSTYALGTLELIEKNSHIQGSVTVRDTNEAFSSQYIYAYKQGGSWDWSSDSTDTDGKYDLLVGPGDWTVYFYPWGLSTASGQKVIYTGGSKVVTVEENETITGQDFTLDVADATLNFLAQNASGTDLEDEYGWVSISEYDGSGDYGWYSSGCYVSRGTCQIDISSGVAYSINYYSYSNWGWYGSDDDTYTYSGIKVDGVSANSVTADKNETQDVVIVMALNDVTVSGQFLEENGDEADIYGEVYATNGSSGWAYVYINGDSTYEMKLSAGTWTLSYWTWGDWMSWGDRDSTSKEITVASGDSVTVDFYVLDNDATVSGTVLDPDGNTVTTPIFVKASTTYGTTETDTGELYGLIEQTTYTGEGGTFSMSLPSGYYYLTASSADYLEPQPVLVTADDQGSGEDITLQFISTDSTITGTVTDGTGISVNNRRTQAVGDSIQNAFIYGYSLNGSSWDTYTDANGLYTIPAKIGDTWFIGAVYQIENTAYYSSVTSVTVDEASETANLLLDHTMTMPKPQSVQFDPQDATVVELEDGATVNIPANAITTVNDGSTVTVNVTPTLELANQTDDKSLSYGYEMSAMDDSGDPITEFASSVTFEIPYSEEDLNESLQTEEDINVKNYKEVTSDWEKVDGGVVFDTENNTATITVDHFSKFAITSGRSVATASQDSDGDGVSDVDEIEDPDADDDDSDNEEEVGEVQILTTPTSLAASKRMANKLQLTWDEVGSADSYQIALVNVKTNKKIKTVAATGTTKTIKKLVSNKKYGAKIRALGFTGSQTAWSDTITTRTKPAAPKFKTLRVKQALSDSALISWKKPRGTITKYVIQVSKGKKVVKTLKTKKRKITIPKLNPGTRYAVRIKAKFNKENVSTFSKKRTFVTAAL